MTEAALVLNVGSSSVKFALYAMPALELLCRGGVDAIGTDRAKLGVAGPRAADLEGASPLGADHAAVAAELLRVLDERLPDVALVAAGHRVVHGRTAYSVSVRIDAPVLEALERFVP